MENKRYDIIIANINRNILMQDIPVYAKRLNKNGILLLSGFYVKDIPMINKEATKNKLQLENQLERNSWVALKFRRL